jgi:hypothetical protein
MLCYGSGASRLIHNTTSIKRAPQARASADGGNQPPGESCIAQSLSATAKRVHRRTVFFARIIRDVAYSTLLKIARVLGVDVSELIDEIPDGEE